MEMMEIEFRGIPVNQLQLYFEELDGERLSEDFPIVFEGRDWKGEISNEEEVNITSTLCVNAVHVTFTANEKKKLDELIKRYRKKTTRVGMAPPRFNLSP